MSTQREMNRSYSKLAQIFNSFRNDYPTAHQVKNVLKKEGDINFKIPQNSPADSIEPTLIGCTALHLAALNNDPIIFEILLKEGADFTAQSSDGRTALHYLIDQPKFARESVDVILSTQLSLGDPSNPYDSNGLSHFHIACWQNNVATVEFFLNSGIPVDMTVNFKAKKFAGYTALHFAAEGMALTTIGLLLKHNANMDVKDARGLTPLHLLLEEKIKTLDRHRAKGKKIPEEIIVSMDDTMDLLLSSNDVDDIGLTHFHVACTQRDICVAEYFLVQNLDIDQPVKFNSPIRPGYTALHFAVHCNLNVVKMLLKRKANYEARDANGLTPMDLIWEKCKEEELQTILQTWKYVKFADKETRLLDFIRVISETKQLEYYLKHVEDITTTMNAVDATYWRGRTLLHFAVMVCENTDVIKVCMKLGLDKLVNVKDFNGSTPIHLAFRSNKLDVVECLVQCTIVFFDNDVDNEGLSYLHIACSLQTYHFFNRIFQVNNSNVVYRGKSTHGFVTPGTTILHVAMAPGKSRLIRELLKWNWDLEARDANGETPFHRFLQLESKSKKGTLDLSHYVLMIDKISFRQYVTFPGGTKDICKMLLQSGKLKNRLIRQVGLTRLHLMIYCGEFILNEHIDEKNVEAVIKCSDPSSVFFPYDGCTPLHMAIKIGAQEPVVEKLLDYGADLLAKNDRGDAPLYDALSNYSNENSMNLIVRELQLDDDLQKRMEDISGITMLHIACHMLDPNVVYRLLSEGAKVNARVKSDCPVLPDCTPLHVLLKAMIQYREVTDDACRILKMLLDAGADVATLDGNDETPLDLSMRQFSSQFVKVTMPILRKLRVFNGNSLGRNIMSCFHAACLANNVEVVKSFLENGVDVNQPIEFFAKSFAGETPLHLAVDRRTEMLNSPILRKDTVDLLLKYGADVKAENSRGETVLHKAVKLKDHLDILEKLVELGAAIDARNIIEKTPLEFLLQSPNISVEKIEFFKNHGCRLNVSNPLTEEGYASMIISQNYHKIDNAVASEPTVLEANTKEIVTQCFFMVVYAADSYTPDDMGRNLIHNIVTTNKPVCEIFSYDGLIKRFQSIGIDIDLQDKKGKTALHLAAQFGNRSAVDDLLNNGADINILDATNRTPLNYAMEYYHNKKYCPEKECHKYVLVLMLTHIGRLQKFNLEIRQDSILKKEEAFTSIFAQDASFVRNYEDEMNTIPFEISKLKERITLESKLTLIDFFSERGEGLTSYPFMPDFFREKVDVFFREYKYKCVDVYALQYRKAVKRVTLVELAGNILSAIAGSILSTVCVEKIFQYLTNSELENLIEATKL